MSSVPERSRRGARCRQRLRRRFAGWIDRRIPPARAVTLNQKRIFIMPSRVGFFFGLCLLLMLLTAINYENNMSYALTFLLATLFVVATLHTYANLSGLTIRAVRAQAVFPGQQSEFVVAIERGGRHDHCALRAQWPHGSQALFNLVDADSAQLRLQVPVARRGWHHPGRLLLESTYPLGLLRCWTWIDLDLQALVYPQPLPSTALPGAAAQRPDGASLPVPGSDDFYGFRAYRPGDSPRQVYWKGLARERGLQTKQYTAYTGSGTWLDWDLFPGLGTEQRLSQLCYWALALHARNEEYGLRLPGVVIAPAAGEQHRDQVLRELALYRVQAPPR
ncbi:MAG: DUF58 domain-containing protein [Halioglobus sp.]|nr:DUF58 domain-containing protein [Halioglobus sp.]